VRRALQHVDVGAGAEDLVARRGDLEHAHLRLLEAQALDRVGQLHVDAEVVAVELERVARPPRLLFLDVHHELRDGAVDGEFPVEVTRGVALEVEGLHEGGDLSGRLRGGQAVSCSRLDEWWVQ
jgi:hypothetical protein